MDRRASSSAWRSSDYKNTPLPDRVPLACARPAWRQRLPRPVRQRHPPLRQRALVVRGHRPRRRQHGHSHPVPQSGGSRQRPDPPRNVLPPQWRPARCSRGKTRSSRAGHGAWRISSASPSSRRDRRTITGPAGAPLHRYRGTRPGRWTPARNAHPRRTCFRGSGRAAHRRGT